MSLKFEFDRGYEIVHSHLNTLLATGGFAHALYYNNTEWACLFAVLTMASAYATHLIDTPSEKPFPSQH